MELNFTELRDLLTTLNETDITELTIKIDNFEMTVRKEAAPLASATLPAQLITSMEGVAFSSSSYPTKSDPAPSPVPTPGTSFSTPAPAPLSNERLVDITSPMVGTFYRAPGPDEAPFVEIGDRVRSGQTVCIIEAMKLMNEIEAEVVGEIVEILVQNAQPVEYGQVLMRVKPN